jgi:hypothetical protein
MIILVIRLNPDGLKVERLVEKKTRRHHRKPRSYTKRSTFEKRENFYQLISTLFCEVK